MRLQFGVGGDFAGVEAAVFAFQVGGDELVADQLGFAVFEFKVGATEEFAPLIRLHDGRAVLHVGAAGGVGHIRRFQAAVFVDANGGVRVSADNHVKRFGGQAAGKGYVAGGAVSVFAVVVVADVGERDAHVGLGFVDLGQYVARGFNHGLEGNVAQVFGVAELGGVFGGEPDHGEFQAAAFDDGVGFHQIFAVFIAHVGGKEGEFCPAFLFVQQLQGVVEFVVAQRKGIEFHGVQPFDVGFGVLQVGFGHAGVEVAGMQ